MRILLVNTETTWRGGERQTLYTALGLRDLGVTAEILCRKDSPLADKCRRRLVPTVEVPSHRAALRRLASNGSAYDVIHAQTAKGQSLAVLSKPFHRTPVAYTRRVDFKPRGIFARLKYHRTDRVVAISQAIRNILEVWGLKDVRLISSAAVEQGATPGRIQEIEGRYHTGSRKVLGTVAAFVDHKDPRTMLEAVSLLATRRKGEFVFMHFGEGPLKTQMEAEVERRNLGEHYIFMGFEDDLAPYYRILDVFCMSSCEEGLGSSVLDAFLARVPVASTDAGGLKELVDGRGLLCPARNPQCLAEAMERLMDDEKLAEELTAKARSHALEKHSLEAISRACLNLYLELAPHAATEPVQAR